MTITIASLVSVFVYVVLIGLIFWLLWWGLERINPPQPFLKIGEVILAVLAVLAALNILLSFAGHPLIHFR